MLAGLKVLDFSTLLPGPFATLMLADLGADVIHVTKPQTPEWHVDVYLQRSKRQVEADLRDVNVVEQLLTLIGEYDIVVEQFRPGVMAKLGLGYEQIKAIHPHIIYCSITGYGQTGPYKDRAGHDINYVATAGIQSYSGTKASGPAPLGIQIADLAGGSLHAVIGILAAVIHRQATGEGQHLDISMTDCALSLNALAAPDYFTQQQIPQREELMLNGGMFYGHYETEDGRHFAVGSLEPKFSEALCEAIERPDLIPLTRSFAPSDVIACKEALTNIFKTKTYEQWRTIFAQVDACVEPVLTFEEVAQHPLFQARNMFVEVVDVKGNPQIQLACPIKSSVYTPQYTTVGAARHAHTEQLLRAVKK